MRACGPLRLREEDTESSPRRPPPHPPPMLGFSFSSRHSAHAPHPPPFICSLTLWLGMGFTLDGTMLPRRPRVVHVSGLSVWPYYLSTYTASSYSSSSPKYSLSVRVPRSLRPLSLLFPLSPFPLQSCRYDAHAPILSVNYSTATLPTRSFVPSVRPSCFPPAASSSSRSLARLRLSSPPSHVQYYQSSFLSRLVVCRRSRSSIH